MKAGKKNRIVSLLLVVILAVTGCGNGVQNEAGQADMDTQSGQDQIQQSIYGREDDFGALLVSQGIDLPVSTTKVFVNQSGYISDRDKKVMFLGEQIGRASCRERV